MTFRCGCGRELPLPAAGDSPCAACGAVYEIRPGWRSARCECGAVALAAPGQVGTSVPCGSCYLRVQVAVDAPPAPPLLKTPPRPAAPKPPRRDRLRTLFLLTLAPLLVHVFLPSDGSAYRELVQRAKSSPQVQKNIAELRTVDQVFRLLQIDRVGDAWQSRFSMEHWIFAMAAAGAFWGLILLLFPLGTANSLHLWTVGLLMGTAGILLLLGVQRVALSFGERAVGCNPLWLVGSAYRAAFNPDSGFLKSLVGFTLGVGLCEELVKLLPLAVVYRRSQELDVRGAVAWGLAMGAGFGLSEAIHYSGVYYNGLSRPPVYVVRFVSCVALHMVWSGAAAARLWGYRDDLQGGWKWILSLLLAAAGSIALHGLYDALLKSGLEFIAFMVAVASFAYFFASADGKAAEEGKSPVRA